MGGEEEASITEQAYAEFAVDRTTFQDLHHQHNLPLGPVYIRNFSLKKDPSYCGSSSLQTAPNFVSALLGKTIAHKLRLDGSPSTENNNTNDSSSSSSSSYVFQNVNALLRPGEGTLLLVSCILLDCMCYYACQYTYTNHALFHILQLPCRGHHPRAKLRLCVLLVKFYKVTLLAM